MPSGRPRHRGIEPAVPRDRDYSVVSRELRGLRAILARYSFAGAVLLIFAWLSLMRGFLTFQSGVWPNPGWMVLADLVGAVVLALLLSIVRKAWMRVMLAVLMGTAFYAAGAHMGAHESIFRLAHAGKMADSVFVTSSVASPWLLMLPVYWLLAYLLHRFHQRIDRAAPPRPWRHLAAAIVCIAVYGFAVTSLTHPANNVVVSTLAQIPGSFAGLVAPPERGDLEPIDTDTEKLFFHREVRGEPVEDPPNVLLVLIEGLSAGYLPSVAEYHDLSPAVSLPALERELSTRGFRVYRNVLSMQRQTDRGIYPLLCGTYPRVGTATSEMADVAADEADPRCVPHVLASHGYRTGFLQAAPLEYMDKDKFMPRAGFERVDGAEYFGFQEDEQGWGPGASIFFQGAVDWIDDLAADNEPWYAVMLNADTHHPFPRAEPEDQDGEAADEEILDFEFQSEGSQPERQAAFEAMARELSGLLDRLAAEGILDDTLVIISSDEAGGFLREENGPRTLDGNFGVLAVRPPGGGSLEQFTGRDSLVATLDIALTTLDAAGLAERSEASRAMVGRSLLVQEPDDTRGLLLGDTYAGHTLFVLESGELIACGESLIRCATWRFSPGRVFGSLSEDVEADPYLEFRTRRQLVNQAAVIEKIPDEDEGENE